MTDCPNCNGAGTIRAETTDRGEDDYEYDAECPACCGTGSSDLADAINALPYSLHRVRPGVEVVSKAEVLAIIKARAALAAPAVPPEGCTPADAAMLRRANHGLAEEVHMLQAALADLHRQVQEFVATYGEADFYTGAALAVLAKTGWRDYRWPYPQSMADDAIAKLLAAAPTAQQEPARAEGE